MRKRGRWGWSHLAEWLGRLGCLRPLIDSPMLLMFAAVTLQDYKELNRLLEVLGAQHNHGLVFIQRWKAISAGKCLREGKGQQLPPFAKIKTVASNGGLRMQLELLSCERRAEQEQEQEQTWMPYEKPTTIQGSGCLLSSVIFFKWMKYL